MRRACKNSGEQHKKAISDTEVNDNKNIATIVRLINAQLRYYMNVSEPDLLSNEEWASMWNDLIWIRKQEAKNDSN